MTAEWSAARLDALPESAVIEFTTWMESTGPHKPTPDLAIAFSAGQGRWWETMERGAESSEWLADPTEVDPGSIRVVSVPVDALLSGTAVVAAALTFPDERPVGLAENAIRAAIAHVTEEGA